MSDCADLEVSLHRRGTDGYAIELRFSQPSSDADIRLRLLLDFRVVDVLRLSNLILVTLASLKPFFFNGLKQALHFSDNVGT